jgi:adenine/guanine/hypoxanthine permease
VPTARLRRALDSWFGLTARGTTVRREALAGATTFVTMAYIVFVNPAVLGSTPDGAGVVLPRAALLTSTALVACVMTIAMGAIGRLPLALAAGMGLNTVVAAQLAGAHQLTWAQAMGVIVAEGLVISALVLTGVRQAVVRAVPLSLKRAIGIGIGLFLALIGFVDAGFVSRNLSPNLFDPVPVVLGRGGHLAGFPAALFAATLLFTAWLVARGVRGALLVGMAASTAAAIAARALLGPAAGFAPHEVVLPSSPLALPDFSLLGRFDLSFVHALGWTTAALIVFSLMLSDFFDTVGTVVAVGQEAGYLDAQGGFPRPGTVLLIDSLAAVAGGMGSSSSATTYVESAAGAAAGGRTGLASVFTGLLFGACLFVSPLAGVVPAQATGAILVLVGFLMMREVGALPWDDAVEAIPAFLTFTVMPFTYSITNGIGAGFVSHVVLMAARGRARRVHPLMAAAAAAFVVYFVVA